jgi:hypothetical protein
MKQLEVACSQTPKTAAAVRHGIPAVQAFPSHKILGFDRQQHDETDRLLIQPQRSILLPI